jgi:serine/threonine protein kinase
MMDYNGHVKLVDFGLSKCVTTKQNLNHSFVGSDGYIAPEIKLKQGHNFLNDVYAVGVLLYDLLHCYLPFNRTQMKARKHEQIYQMHNEISFRDGLTVEVKELISRLVSLAPEKRLDGEDDILEILYHPWFKNCNAQINAQICPCPQYMPDVSKYQFDMSLLPLTDEMLYDIRGSIS